MKYLLQPLAALSLMFLVNCSSIPEIKPYKEQPKELTIEEVKQQSGLYNKDGVFDDEPTTPLEDAALPDGDSDEAKLAEVKAEVDNDATTFPEEPMTKPEVKAAEPKQVAAVEKPAPKKKTVAAKQSRLPSSFKNGMHVFAQDCMMKSEPSPSAADAGSVQAGKKLWLDAHNGEWLKAYKKAGTVYVSAECIKK